MFPILEPVSNHFLLSLLILVPGVLLLKHFPWEKLSDTTLAINQHQITLRKDNLIITPKLLLGFLTPFISLSIFSIALSSEQAWLRSAYLAMAIVLVVLMALGRQNLKD